MWPSPPTAHTSSGAWPQTELRSFVVWLKRLQPELLQRSVSPDLPTAHMSSAPAAHTPLRVVDCSMGRSDQEAPSPRRITPASPTAHVLPGLRDETPYR